MNVAQRGAIWRFLNMLAEKGVGFVEGVACPCTDGQTVYMPYLTGPESKSYTLNGVCGWALHEAGHILHSDFTIAGRSQGVKRELVNALEDTRIEARMCEAYPGAPLLLNASEHSMVDEGRDPMKEAVKSGVAATLTTYCCLHGILHRPEAPTADWQASLDAGRKYLVRHFGKTAIDRLDRQLATVGSLPSTQAVEALAEQILSEIKLPPPPKQKQKSQSSKGKGQKQDQQEEQSSNGSGEGEGESQQKADDKSKQNPEQGEDAGSKSDSQSDEGSKDEDESKSQNGKSGSEGGEESKESESSKGSEGKEESEQDKSKSEEQQGQGSSDEDDESESGEDGEGEDEDEVDEETRRKAVEDLENASERKAKSKIQNELGGEETKSTQSPSKSEASEARNQISRFRSADQISSMRLTQTKWRYLKPNEGLAEGEAVVEQAKQLASAVRTVLTGVMQAKTRSGVYTSQRGSKLDAPSLHRLASGNLNVFQRRDTPRTGFNTAVEVVLDRSGSMSSRMDKAMQAALGMCLAVRQTPGCKAGLIAFDAYGLADSGHSSICEVCVDVLDIEGKNLMPKDVQRIGLASEEGGFTPTHHALARACTVLEDRQEDRKIILAVTDDDVGHFPVIRDRARKAGIDIYFVVLASEERIRRSRKNLEFLTKGFEGLDPSKSKNFVQDFKQSLFRLVRKGMFGAK